MAPASACPEPRALEHLLEGLLTKRDERILERHIDQCEACQNRLESLAEGEAAWPRRMRDLGQAGFHESPALKQVIGSLKDQFNSEYQPGSKTQFEEPDELPHLLDPPEVPGDLGKLGPYRVLQILGQGGMGIVLRAFDSGLNRPIAIKVLAPRLATSGPARRRFLREARAAAAIRDEHVVAIHAVEEWKGLPYLVMELVPGTSLQDRLDRFAPLDADSILRIGMQTAKGLAAAHAQGLVHRDIKPSNILLENGVERVKLTDFGLARAVDDASLTQSGVVAGTPLFMSPEQAQGESIDHRADLFSLGAVMYAMSTGRPPFRASTALGVLRRVCDDEHRPIQEVNPDIPAWLAEIIDRLLTKDRRDRFQKAADVAQVLGDRLAQRQGAGSTVKTLPPARPPVAFVAHEDVGPQKGRRRRYSPWAWLAALAVLLLALLIFARVAQTPHVFDRITAAIGLGPSLSTLKVIKEDPRVRVRIDGDWLDPSKITGSGVLQKQLAPGWHTVEAFVEDRKVEGYKVQIGPGRSLTLRLRAANERAVESTPLTGQALWKINQYQALRNHLDEAKARAAKQRDRLVWANQMLAKGYISSEAREQEFGRMVYAKTEVALAEAALRYAENPVENEENVKEAVAEMFKFDPRVASLIAEIKKTREELDSNRSSRIGEYYDPARLAAMERLRKLTEEYNKLWESMNQQLKDQVLRAWAK